MSIVVHEHRFQATAIHTCYNMQNANGLIFIFHFIPHKSCSRIHTFFKEFSSLNISAAFMLYAPISSLSL